MSSLRHYLPYDEVILASGSAADRVVLTTPWVQFEFQAEFPSEGDRARLIEDVNAKDIHEGNFDAIDGILGVLSRFPIAYVFPNPDLAEKPPYVAVSAPEPSSDTELSWNVQWAERFCRVPDTDLYDPVSLFSVLRRFHLAHLSAEGRGRFLYRNLNRLGGEHPTFLPFVRSILRQNHRVTQLCESSLSPALAHCGSARPILENFIHSERGHDRLLEKSLRALGTEPEAVEVLPEVEALMSHLKEVATHDFVGYCALLFFFESDFVGGKNPLVAALKASPYASAAVGLETHDKVNHEGDHENVSFELLEALGPIGKIELVSAVRSAEIGSRLMSKISPALLQRHELPAE